MALSNISEEEEKRLQEQFGDDEDAGATDPAPTPGPGDPTRDINDGGETVMEDTEESTPDTDDDDGRTVVGGDRQAGPTPGPGDPTRQQPEEEAPTPGPGDPTRQQPEEEAPTPGPGDPTRDMEEDQPNEQVQAPGTPGPGDPTRTDIDTAESPTGAEVGGEGFLVGSGIAGGPETAESILAGQIARQSDEFTADDIAVTVGEEGDVEVRLTESGAARRGGVEPQVLTDDISLQTTEAAARDVEGRVVAEMGVDRSEVAVGEFSLQPRFTEEGIEAIAAEDSELAAGELQLEGGTIRQTQTSQRARTAAALGVGFSDIDIRNGSVAALTEAGEEALAVDTRPGRGGGTGQTEAAAEIEGQLEEQTGTELDREDIAVEADGDVVRGTLSREGEREVAAQRAPLQGTPLSGITSAGARLDVRGTQFRQENVKRAQEITGIERLFAGEEQFLDATSQDAAELVNIEPADLFDSEVEAPDVTGGTLPVFSGTAGGAAGISRGAAIAGSAVGSGIAAGAAALEGETPEARTEVPLPESGEPLVQDEVVQPSRPGLFRTEVPIPDPMERPVGPLGVPELGITIETGEEVSVVDTTEIPTESPVSPTELEMEETDSESFVKADTATETGGTTTGDTPSPSMPGDSLPTPGEVGGESSSGGGGGFNIGESRRLGQAKQVGRTFDEDKALTDTEELFLGIGADTPSSLELVDFAGQAQASGDAGSGLDAISTPLDAGIADANAASQAATDAAADATPASESTTATTTSTTATTTTSSTGTATPNLEIPAFNLDVGLNFEFGAPTVTSPGFDVPGRTPRVPLPRREPPSDDDDRDRRRTAADLFDNPALAPDELGAFEEDLLEDLE